MRPLPTVTIEGHAHEPIWQRVNSRYTFPMTVEHLAHLVAKLRYVADDSDQSAKDFAAIASAAGWSAAAVTMANRITDLERQLAESERGKEAAERVSAEARRVLGCAERLVRAYEKDGNGVGVRSCEDALIGAVKLYRASKQSPPVPEAAENEP